MTLRLLKAFFVAVLLACVLMAITEAQESNDCEGPDPAEDCVVVYYPGICGYLTPYSYWWYFHDCANEATATSESVTYTFAPDGALTTEVTRTYADGTLIRFWRTQRPAR